MMHYELPILKIADYDLWSMRMEQYLTHTNYALWEVIMNGDAPAIASASTEVISQEDANLKLLRSLPLAWNNIALIMRNKADLDELSNGTIVQQLKADEYITNFALMGYTSQGSSSSDSECAKNESTASKSSKDSLEQPKDVRPSAPIIEEWESDSDDDCVIRPSFEQNKPSYAKINFVKSDENTRKSVIEQHTYRQA
ncbi:hypothetical protein Tco_1026404 [Tanacetum coccineum]